MGERRQVHRREGIELELSTGEVLVANPLPWMKRSDLADEIVKQNIEGLNELTRMFTDEETGAPQLEARAGEKITNWVAVLRIAFPDQNEWNNTTFGENVQLLLAALEVNELTHLNALVDPNSVPLPQDGGTNSLEEGTELGQKTESSADSDSQDLDDPTFLNSPTGSSGASSTSTTSSSGTSDTSD